MLRRILSILLFGMFQFLLISANAQNLPVRVITTNITSNTVFRPDTVYLIDANITVADGIDLLILPKTILKFGYRANATDKIHLDVYGRIIAQGKVDSTISFVSAKHDSLGGDSNGDGVSYAGTRDWGYIRFYNSGSILKYCNIFHAGGHTNYYALWLTGGLPWIENCNISRTSNSTAINVSYTGFDSLFILKTYIYCDSFGINYSGTPGTLQLKGNNILSGKEGIYFNGSFYNRCLIDSNSVTSRSNTNGIYIKYTGNDSLIISRNQITSANMRSIYYEGNTNRLSSPKIRDNIIRPANSGQYGIYCYYTSASAELTGNDLRNCQYGIYLYNSSPSISGNIVDHQGVTTPRYPFYQRESSFPTYGSNTLTGRTYLAIGMEGPIANSGSVGNNLGLPYVILLSLDINAGATLTANAGSIFKLDRSSGQDKYIIVNGVLNLQSTLANPIYFTSSYDDQIGGDSNDDSTITMPTPGDWRWLQVAGANNNIHNCVFKYGGYSSNSGQRMQLYVSGNAPIIRDNLFQNIWVGSDNRIIYYNHTGSDTGRVVNNTLVSGGGYGIWYVGNTNAVAIIDSNIIRNIGYDAIRIYSVKDTSSVSFNTITDFPGYGIYFEGASPKVRNNIFDRQVGGSNTYAFYQYGNSLPIYLSNNLSGRINRAIAVGGTISRNGRWASPDSLPYVVVSDITLNSGDTLSIAAGTVVKFDAMAGTSYRRLMIVNGILGLQGTSGNPVYFTSSRDDSLGGDSNGDATQPAAGDWGHVRINNGGNDIHDCVFKYGGAYPYPSYNQNPYVLWSQTGSPTVRDNQFRYVYDQAIYYQYSGSGLGRIDSNTVSGGNISIYVSSGDSIHVVGNSLYNFNSYGIYCANASPLIQDNTFGNNSSDKYIVYQEGSSFPRYFNNILNGHFFSAKAVSGTINRSGTWSMSDNIPYILIGDISIPSGVNLTVNAGTIIKMLQSNHSIMTVDGTLALNSTSQLPIVFTSSRDDQYGGDSNNDTTASVPAPGDWGYLRINNSNMTLANCIFRYGGYRAGAVQMLIFMSGNPVIRDNYFEQCYNTASCLYCSGNSNYFEITGNTFNSPGNGIVVSSSQDNTNFHIYDNVLNGGGSGNGIDIDGTTTAAQIWRNEIAGYSIGINLLHSSPSLRENTVSSNITAGIRINRTDAVSINPDIQFNTIVGNTSYGIQYYTSSSSQPHPNATLSHNGIFNNAGYNVYFNTCSNPSDTVSLLNNWWGVTDSTQIAAKIYDHYDNASSPYSKFRPCLLGPEDSLCASDFNLSGRVDGGDLIPLAIAFGSDPSDADWNPVCDLDASFRIDGFDLAIFGTEFGSIGGCPDRLLKREPMPLESLVVTLNYPSDTLKAGEDYFVEISLESPIPTNGLVFELDLSSLELTGAEFVPAPYYGDEATQYCLQTLKDGVLFGGLSRLSCSGIGVSGNGVLGSLRLRASKDALLEEIPISELSFVDPYGTSFYNPVIKHIFKSDSNLPTTLELSQNYPNPFNASTIIRFALPQSGEVSLSVYNILGQRVRMLANSTMDAGYHQVTWDGTNETGERVSSGVYYYLLDTQKYQQAKKMTILK
jgi:parallel beta-helix repeat protein